MFNYELRLMKCFNGSFINECGEFINSLPNNENDTEVK
jgi:hypothetical protein